MLMSLLQGDLIPFAPLVFSKLEEHFFKIQDRDTLLLKPNI